MKTTSARSLIATVARGEFHLFIAIEDRRRTYQLHQQGVFGVLMSTSAANNVPLGNECGQLNRDNKVATPVRVPQNTGTYTFLGGCWMQSTVKFPYFCLYLLIFTCIDFQ